MNEQTHYTQPCKYKQKLILLKSLGTGFSITSLLIDWSAILMIRVV